MKAGQAKRVEERERRRIATAICDDDDDVNVREMRCYVIFLLFF